MSETNNKPWEEILDYLWRSFFEGRRWLGTSVVIIFLVIPFLINVFTFYFKTTSDLRIWSITRTTTITPQETNVLNEWIAPISYWDSKEEAEKQAEVFKELYMKYETLIHDGGDYKLWRDDILVVRNLKKEGNWMVVIDTYYGTSSYPAVTNELARLSKLGGSDVEARNTYQRLFINSQAQCYSQEDFELTYGKIEPSPVPKLDPYKKEYPPCNPENK